MTLSAAHPSASASSPLGTTIGLALLRLVSDLTGKLPPSVMAERRRYYSDGQNYYRQRSRSARARRDEQQRSRQKRAAADEAPSSDQQLTTGPIRRMQDSKLLDQLFGEGFELTVKDTPECEDCSDCGKSCVIVSIAVGGLLFLGEISTFRRFFLLTLPFHFHSNVQPMPLEMKMNAPYRPVLTVLKCPRRTMNNSLPKPFWTLSVKCLVVLAMVLRKALRVDLLGR